MTVWAVTVNGYVEGIYATREAAGEAVEQHKRSSRLNRTKGGYHPDQWDPVGRAPDPDSWHSTGGGRVTRTPYEVEA